MRAAVCTRYGPPEVLQLQEVEKPVPGDDEVLIKIHATTVTSSDWFIRSALRFAPVTTQILMRLVMGITRPRKPILGMVLAGEIEKAGKRVGRFRVGDSN
jgi:NADPH:quinone reductase-like Zn-dependent oxidoreductase